MALEFVLCGKRKYQYPVKPIFCLFLERYPISGKLQDEYNYNRQIDAEKERGRDGFSLEDNQVEVKETVIYNVFFHCSSNSNTYPKLIQSIIIVLEIEILVMMTVISDNERLQRTKANNI